MVTAATYYANKQIYDPIILWRPSLNHQRVHEQQVLHKMLHHKKRLNLTKISACILHLKPEFT